MKHTLLFDHGKCTGCRMCELACSFEHNGEFSPARSRISVLSLGGGVDMPISCLQCEDPACMGVCSSGAISQKDGVVSFDAELCTGCRLCMMACPVGSPSIDPVLKRAVNCDLCEGEPACVEFCPFGAVEYVPATHSALVNKKRIAERLSAIWGE
ncbi:4Fe-4S ferredoxin [Methanosarcinales archaeon ex4572_44]|nr:MAG: 4Fe-4S ferredoxin [Methanosarcinales archaeon ex4484_138]PHP45244.1 MAG: 4Fe-4S ferredoxin [Methanosarcinales archaeon ex4572_44]RLG24138.1 MAG: 4Fe-4S dicluster domain-containing protein [Methanosarcinales archaeon]RLG28078.1 MAG: 4Fe-4S dicluster domain-containing protein [Methanosarcinales archaeon]